MGKSLGALSFFEGRSPAYRFRSDSLLLEESNSLERRLRRRESEAWKQKKTRGADSTILHKLECVHARKGLVLPRAGEIALAGSRLLRSTLAAAPVHFVHDIVTVYKNK